MGRIVLGNNSTSNLMSKGETIYVDNPVEVIKEVLLPCEPTIVEKIVEVEKIIYVDRPVSSDPRIIEIEKTIFIDKPVEKIVEVEKIVYVDKVIEVMVSSEPIVTVKEVKVPFPVVKSTIVHRLPNWAWLVMVCEFATIVALLIK